jgi:hypothetical protein
VRAWRAHIANSPPLLICSLCRARLALNACSRFTAYTRRKLRDLTPTAEFGPFFHTGFAFGGHGYRFRLLKVLEIIGIGNSIGFDSLVRATFQITIGMLASEAMKIVRKTARVLTELVADGMVKFSGPSGFIRVLQVSPTHAPYRPIQGEVLEVLDNSMDWFLAEVIGASSARY